MVVNNLFRAEILVGDHELKNFTSAFDNLIKSMLPFIIGIAVSLTVIWAIYIGAKLIMAKKADQRVEAKRLIMQFFAGFVVIAVLVVLTPVLVAFLRNWVANNNSVVGNIKNILLP